MYGVHAPDADAVRRLIPTVQDLLEWPYCSYLFYLARRVDHEAIAFLERYAEAVHDETGEAIAVIVLFDDIEVLGQIRGRENGGPATADHRRVVDDPQIVYGSYALTRDRVPQRTTSEFRAASPRWSLKFADALGLNRSFLPCLVAFDHAEGAEPSECVVLDLSNADEAWNILRDAIAGFMAVPASQQFVLAAERIRTLTRDLRAVSGTGPAAHYWAMPTTPEEFLRLLTQPDHPDRAPVLDLVSRSPDRAAVATLNRFIGDNAALKAVANHEACVESLRRHWLDAEFRSGAAPARVVRRLADALRILGQDPAAAAVDEVLLSDVERRPRFVEAVGRAGRAELAAITRALEAVRAAARPRELRLRDEIDAVRGSVEPEPFLPHLAAAIDSASRHPGSSVPGTKVTLRRKIAGATGFAANVAQILQGIGAIP
ncbi:hypothetical protein [Amycolatopsis sp. lyj-23]|uniref:hypothetical protein n=1 Tax=Amycolatopsis sp. lyj-23 TaxID=2789283 RepID=UPI003979E425